MNRSLIKHTFVYFALTFLVSIPVQAQVGFGFGQNKVHYKNFDWSIFRTDHFDVYYYKEAEEAARDGAKMAERGYEYLSKILDHKFKKRIPLILYASLNDFQQTNVIQGMLGDGTRGVTEGLKQRVALPITGSYRDFNHVLVHELVHAFQFDIIFNSKKGSRFNPPLWFMEGMAEYLSNGMDNITRMWVRDGLENEKLLTIEELNSTFDIRVYRIGQSLWHHIGENYGKEKIGHIMKSAVNLGNLEIVFKKQLGKDFKQLTEEWHTAVKGKVTPDSLFVLQTPNDISEQITKQESFYHRMNVTPSVSPDGNMVAYVSNKNLNDEIHLLKRDENGNYRSEGILKGGRSKQFESLHILDTSIGWSKDSKWIAFVSKAGRDDHLYVMDPFNKKIIYEFNFENMNGLLSPTFSPDKKNLAFVGMWGGKSNLYTVELASGKLKQLTDDKFSILHPQWSPDGEKIIYATDRGNGTNIDELLFGDYDLATFELSTGKIEMLTDLKGDIINPNWSQDGNSIVFVSDHQGIQNIYRMDMQTQEMKRVTSLKNGISGITGSTPSFSLSANNNVLVFSSFVNESWQLFRMELSEWESLFVENKPEKNADNNGLKDGSDIVSDTRKTNFTDNLVENNWLPENPEPNDLYSQYNLADDDSIEAKKYGTKLKLDGIFLGANIGGYFGSVGGAQFLFSDMLGNKNLILSSGLRFNDLRNSDVGVTYFNQSRRLNYGIGVFQQNYTYGAFSTFSQLGFIEQTYRTATVFGLYPFSRFARAEISAGYNSVSQRLILDTFSFFGDRDREKIKLGTLEFGQIGGSLVFDNTIYGLTGPIGGSRSRFSIQRALNDLEFTSFFADYRRYINVNVRSSFAWRLMAATSTGRDAQFYRIGGPFTFRGADYDELIGPNILIQNLEYRFPLLPFLNYRFDFLSGIAFFDAAAAWGFNAPGFIKETFQPFSSDGGFRFKDLNSALGVGARFHLGYLSLRFDLAWPTDMKDIGEMRTFFSIGTDF